MRTITVDVVELVNPSSGASKEVVPELTRRIEAEYAEMPGLSLTLPQAQRLWSIDRVTCMGIFTALIDRKVICRTSKGCYVGMRTY